MSASDRRKLEELIDSIANLMHSIRLMPSSGLGVLDKVKALQSISIMISEKEKLIEKSSGSIG